MWMQYKENGEKALNNYLAGLNLGGTKTLPELFSAAGLHFDLSPQHIGHLMNFVKKELDGLTTV
jgi:oligoendopeptidase F